MEYDDSFYEQMVEGQPYQKRWDEYEGILTELYGAADLNESHWQHQLAKALARDCMITHNFLRIAAFLNEYRVTVSMLYH